MSDAAEPKAPWFVPLQMQREAREKQVFFRNEPDTHELAVPMGWGEIASSSNTVVSDANQFRITVGAQPPLWFARICVGIPVIGAMVVIGFVEVGDMRWGLMVAVGVMGAFAATQFVSLLKWVQHLHGNEDYLTLNHISGEVRLPRLDVTLPSKCITRLVAVKFAERLKQVSILASNQTPSSEDDRWLYLWVYNPIQWKEKEISQLAEALQAEVEFIELDKAQTKTAFSPA